MADPISIRPKDLPAAPSVPADVAIMLDNGSSVVKATPGQIADTSRPYASKSDAETGTDNAKVMTALRVKQALDSQTIGKAMAAAVGVAGDAVNMGTTPGTILSDNGTAKQWFQESEAAIEGRALDDVSNVPTTAARAYYMRDVVWYGADPSGVADATSAIQSALDAGCTRFPAGTFKLSGSITVPETTRALVEGAGSGRTKLLFSSGGLVIPCKTAGDNYHFKGVRGITLATSTVGTDTALRIYRTDSSSIDTSIVIDDVICIGSDGIYGTATGPAKYWHTLVDMQDVRFIFFSRSQLHGGGAGKTTYGWRVRTGNTDPQFLVTWNQLNIDGCTHAISIEGWFEGIYGNNFSIFGCRDDILYTHTGTTVGSFSIDNADLFASRHGIKLTNINNVNIGKGVNCARGFIEPGYNTAFQEGGAIGNSTDGYHYAGSIIDIASAGSEGQVTVGGKFYSGFGDTIDFIRLTDVNTFNVDAICYGAASGSGLNLLGTTRSGGWGTLIVDARGSTIAAGVTIAATCSEIHEGNLITNATARIVDSGDILGKYRCSFLAYASADIANVTGDGTFYTAILNSAAYNYGGGYNTGTGQFTAPVTGIYEFGAKAYFGGIVAGHTSGATMVSTAAANYPAQKNVQNDNVGGFTPVETTVQVKLTAGQQASMLSVVNGGTKVVDLLSGLGGSIFWGRLVKQL